MAFQKVKRMLGISAVVICCGTVLFTFEGCKKDEPKAEVVQMQEMTDITDTTEGNAYAKDINLNLSDNDVKSEQEITVFYDQCATESDTLKMINGEQVDYKIKDYQPARIMPYLQKLNYAYSFDEGTGIVSMDGTQVSNNAEIDEDGRLIVRDMIIQTSKPVVKYIRLSDTEVEARYIAFVPSDSKLVSGVTFVMEKDDNGTYRMNNALGVFGEDISGLSVYSGQFDGWAMTVDGAMVYEVGDEIKISGDMTLYPHFVDDAFSYTAKDDGTLEEGQIELIDGKAVLRVIHLKDSKNRNNYALSGLDAEKDTVRTSDGKIIDKERVVAQQTGKDISESKPNDGGNGGNGGNGNGGNGDNGKPTDGGNGGGNNKPTVQPQPSEQPTVQPTPKPTPAPQPSTSYIDDDGLPRGSAEDMAAEWGAETTGDWDIDADCGGFDDGGIVWE